MKPLRIAVFVSLGAAAACAPRQAPPPPPPPVAAPLPRPVQPPPPPPPAADWRDLALTPGSWSYGGEGTNGSVAMFVEGAGSLTLRCHRRSRQVTLSRSGVATGNVMTIRTSSLSRNLPLVEEGEPASAMAVLQANDRFLDAIAFSRGRFTVEVPGTPMLVIPAWPEPARVVEDCRF